MKKLLLFFSLLFLLVAGVSCDGNEDYPIGPCEDEIVWKLVSNNAPDDVVVTPWEKEHGMKLTIEIATNEKSGQIVFDATNKSEILLHGMEIDGEHVRFDDVQYDWQKKFYEDDFISFKLDKNLFTINFKAIPADSAPVDYKIYVGSLEVGDAFHIVRGKI